MSKIVRQTRTARLELRNLHKKYTDELYTIVTKIDKFLETIENAQN